MRHARPPAARHRPPAARPPARPPTDRRRPPRRSAPAELALPCWLLAGGAAALLGGGAWPIALTHRRFSWRSLKRVGANRRAAAARAAQLLVAAALSVDALGAAVLVAALATLAADSLLSAAGAAAFAALLAASIGWEGVVLLATRRASAGTAFAIRGLQPVSALVVAGVAPLGCAAVVAVELATDAAGRQPGAEWLYPSLAVCVAVLLVAVVVARGVALYAIVRAACSTPPPTPARQRRRTRRHYRRRRGADLSAELDPCCSSSVPTRRWRRRATMRVGCRVRLTTADATKHSAARDAWVQLSDDGTTVPRGGARVDPSELSTPSDGRCPAPTRRPPPPTDAGARALAGGGGHARGPPRRSRTRSWHASLNALSEGAEYSERSRRRCPRVGCERSSTVAFESDRPGSAGRYSASPVPEGTW